MRKYKQADFMMNKLLLLGIFLLISTTVWAQTDGNYNYSIGLQTFSLRQMPKIFQQVNNDDYASAWLQGGIIKFNDNQISFRINGYYYYKRNFTFNNQCNNCETAIGNVSNYSIKVGFEKNFNYSVIQPYFAADLGFMANSFRGNISSKSPISSKPPYEAITSKKGAVLSPVFGLKINFLKQLSLYAESNLEFFYSYERPETIVNDNPDTRTFARYYKMEAFLNPVIVGLQIHLNGKD